MHDTLHDGLRDLVSHPSQELDGSVRDNTSTTDRRDFFGLVTASALTLTAAGLPIHTVAAQPLQARAATTPAGAAPWDETWLKRIHGKHRQFFDAMTTNESFGLAFALNFLNLYNEAYHIPDTALTAIVGIRHFAAPMAFTDAIWSKYKLGEFCKINDPQTKAPATRNIYLSEDGVMLPGSSIPKLQQRGVMFTVCNVALTLLSGLAAEAAGLPKSGAKDEWTAGVIPGFYLVPVGVLAVNRAQEKGCTYCSAG